MSSSDAALIERYFNHDAGYKPILIRDGWQIGHLNYMPELAVDAIDRVERHNRTDEVFILFRGTSLLIAAAATSEGLHFEVTAMQPSVTYNIPAGCWHTIAMAPGDVVLIVERDNTHLEDVEYRGLSSAERASLRSLLAGAPGA
ncbi:MAG: hypothetical protein ACM3NQ_16605 [Bacteroidales bacterium]